MMTDDEAVKLCAEAMGWKHLGAIGVQLDEAEQYSTRELDEKYKGRLWCLSGGNDWWTDPEGHSVCGRCQSIPDPLQDDAQAMALLCWLIFKGHHVAFETDTRGKSHIGVFDNIVDGVKDAQGVRRFIVGCVAALQQARNAGR